MIINYLQNQNAWSRVISLDIEGDLKILDEPSKAMLSISMSSRSGRDITTNNFIVNQETLDEEARVIEQLGETFINVKPLVIVGYNICRFDQLVLGLKIRLLDEKFRRDRQYSRSYWALREVLGRSYFLDVADPVRFEIGRLDNVPPKVIGLDKALMHNRFAHLPFTNSKKLVSDVQLTKGLDKWEAIRYLWKNDRSNFEKYASGDSHDTLLLFEELFGFRNPNAT